MPIDITQELSALPPGWEYGPNHALALRLTDAQDAAGIAQLVALLGSPSATTRRGAMRTLFEAAEIAPAQVLPHHEALARLLPTRTPWLAWGAMVALSAMAPIAPNVVYAHLPAVMEGAAGPSVIGRDYAVRILCELATQAALAEDAFALLLELLHTAPATQFVSYVERAAPVLPHMYREAFLELLQARQGEFAGTREKRLVKVIAKTAHR